MSENKGDGYCPECGSDNSTHYNGCSCDNEKYAGGSGQGAKIIFALFCIAGIFIGSLCPPIGGLIKFGDAKEY